MTASMGIPSEEKSLFIDKTRKIPNVPIDYVTGRRVSELSTALF